MKKCIKLYILAVLALMFPASLMASEIAVVVNKENPVESLTAKEVSDFFLSRRRAFPSGDAVLVFEQQRDSSLRESFFRMLNGMTIKQLNAYWARLQFSGEIQPPESLSGNIDVLESVKKNRNAIGYVDAASLDNSVKIILRLKE